MREAVTEAEVIIYFAGNYGDIGCFGSQKHHTPHIDRMAEEGIRLTSFYVSSGVCTPSRASLMTGCYAQRIDMHVSDKGGCVLYTPWFWRYIFLIIGHLPDFIFKRLSL